MKKWMKKQVTIEDIVYAIIFIIAVIVMNVVWWNQFLTGNW